jgi:hypothetical protein
MADADDEQMTSLRRERNDFGVPRAIAEGRADRPTKRAVLRYRNALSRRPSRSIQWWTASSGASPAGLVACRLVDVDRRNLAGSAICDHTLLNR